MSEEVKIAINGGSGKMGRTIKSVISDYPKIKLIGEITSLSEPRDQETIFSEADVVIDFSISSCLPAILYFAKKHRTTLVIGTTGYSDSEFSLMNEYAKEVPILYSANMSIGIAILKSSLISMAKMMPQDFDIEIVETHHRNKKDVPSGTALSIGRAICDAKNFSHKNLTSNVSTAVRFPNQINISSIRAGGLLSEHSVIFANQEEVLTLSHRTIDRTSLAKGALNAALWLSGQPNGLYTIEDMYKI